jgi:hypothetical protein
MDWAVLILSQSHGNSPVGSSGLRGRSRIVLVNGIRSDLPDRALLVNFLVP